MVTATAPEPVTAEPVPDRIIPCWVEDSGNGHLCPDKIAEWLTNNGGSSQWLPTCTGCKDRFLRLNPRTQVRRLP